MSTRGFWSGLNPETVRQQKISYYSGIKKERDSAYKLLEKFAEFEGIVGVSKKNWKTCLRRISMMKNYLI